MGPTAGDVSTVCWPCGVVNMATGKKRLDLAGALLAGLFRQLFRKLTQNVRKYLQLCLDKGSQFVVGTAIKSQVGWCFGTRGRFGCLRVIAFMTEMHWLYA